MPDVARIRSAARRRNKGIWKSFSAGVEPSISNGRSQGTNTPRICLSRQNADPVTHSESRDRRPSFHQFRPTIQANNQCVGDSLVAVAAATASSTARPTSCATATASRARAGARACGRTRTGAATRARGRLELRAIRLQEVPGIAEALNVLALGIARVSIGRVVIERPSVIGDLRGSIGPCRRTDERLLGVTGGRGRLTRRRRQSRPNACARARAGAWAALRISFEEIETLALPVRQILARCSLRRLNLHGSGRRAGGRTRRRRSRRTCRGRWTWRWGDERRQARDREQCQNKTAGNGQPTSEISHNEAPVFG